MVGVAGSLLRWEGLQESNPMAAVIEDEDEEDAAVTTLAKCGLVINFSSNTRILSSIPLAGEGSE